MRCKIPEISWHNRDPVLSVDIQSKSGLASGSYRLASGGTDAHVLIWYMRMTSDEADIELDLAADLTRHQRAVNVVKWSPSGELLASGDDESVIFIWKQRGDSEVANILDTASEQDKEVWITLKVLRGHMEDVYDLSWAPNSMYLVSGSVDNSAIMWDVHKGKLVAILGDHKGFVQGVAWDPSNQHIATLSTDRHLRIFDIQTKRVLHRISKGTLPGMPEDHELHGKRIRYYHDDTLQTFFRRLCYTPDGKLLLTPAGVTDYDGCTRPMHTTYGFSRYALRQPAIVLPCPDQYAVAVRCCPLLFKLRAHNAASNAPVVPLPYRMIFAVATRCSVYFYDTQQRQPFAVISNIHYTRLTDASWSSDGRVLVVSSTDGFCSLITFAQGELGEEYEDSASVLGAALVMGGVTGTSKKSRKQKENARKSAKGEKSREQGATRAPLLEQVVEDAPSPTPIAFKRKVATPPVTPPPTPKRLVPEVVAPKALPVAVVIDKEILSTDEKFESPEKKCRLATPISVRRHPRTPSNALAQTPKQPSDSPLSAVQLQPSGSAATLIAVRRKPRALIAPAARPPDTNLDTEEAMDAWPLPEVSPEKAATLKAQQTSAKAKVTAATVPVVISEATMERTEDMRLVYEDTVEAVSEEHDITATPATPATPATATPGKQTPNKRTPRRVALTTISTPKSKKKLIE